MASKTFLILLAILILLVVQPITSGASKQDNTNPFGFIKHLEGSHKGESRKGLKDIKRYLERFGYLNLNNAHRNDDKFDDQLESAIKSYQLRHHLPTTGELDHHTVTQMMRPRCGVPDIVNATRINQHHIIPDFALYPGNPKWPKNQLTYRIRNGAQVGGMDAYRAAVASAFGKWAQVTRFTFREVNSDFPADLTLGFQPRAHGDGFDFDGRGGVLAHATRPLNGNFAHFDADESWSANPGPDQVDFESIALHEIGHTLGLDHSADPSAVMFAYFGYGPNVKRDLRPDDIQGIRTLYGL